MRFLKIEMELHGVGAGVGVGFLKIGVELSRVGAVHEWSGVGVVVGYSEQGWS